MNDLQDLRDALASAVAERDEAAARLTSAESAVTAADAEYDGCPSDITFAKLETAKAGVARARRDLEARERRVRERTDVLNSASADEDRAELERLQVQLRDRVSSYAPAFAELAKLDRQIAERVVAPLEALNSAHDATWLAAQEIARRLGDFAFESRCQRPKKNEAHVLARVTVARNRAAEGRAGSEAHAWLEPLHKPRWNDTAAQTFEAAEKLLASIKETRP